MWGRWRGLFELRRFAAHGRRVAGGALGVGLFAGACSLVVEPDMKQCDADERCLELFGNDVGYSCQSGVCIRPTCTDNDDCRARGPSYEASVCGVDQLCANPECTTSASCAGGACDLTLGRCVNAAQAGCSSEGDCARYEGFPICADGACVATQCSVAADCVGTSPTMMCIGGKCEDPTWGCIGQLDRRPPASMPTATLRVPVYNVATQMPVASLTARACPLPQFDPTCATPLPGTRSSYDPMMGILTLTGLPQDAPIRLKIDFPVDSGLLGLDLYSQRPPRDMTEGPVLLTIPSAALPGLTASFDPPLALDLEKGQILISVFDCQDKPAGGVALGLSDADKLPDTAVLYAGRDGLPIQGATVTDPVGAASIVNTKIARFTIKTSLQGKPLSEYPITAFSRRLTSIMFYPSLYR